MLLALGAASSALDAHAIADSRRIRRRRNPPALARPRPTCSIRRSARADGEFGGSSRWSTGFSQISPATMSALLAAQSQVQASTTSASTTSASTTSRGPPTSALQDLFSQIDANGDGQISKSGIRKRARRRRHQPRAGRRRVQQTRRQRRRVGQPRRNAESIAGGAGKGGITTITMSPIPTDRMPPAERARPPARRVRAPADRIPIRCCRRCWCDHHVGDQQRRFDHDIHHQCRRLRHQHDLARGDDIVQQRDGLLQFPRADDSARGAGDFLQRRLLRCRSTSERTREPIAASYPNRSRHAGSAPRKGSAVAA